jgi:hypothetical protein
MRERLKDVERELDGLQRLREERDRLRQAITLLDDLPGARSRQQPRTMEAGRRRRTPSGVNRQRALEAIRERPGVTLGELAQTTGIGRSTLSNLTRRLESEGTVVRDELPGGQLGLRLATPQGAELDQAGSGSPEPATPDEDARAGSEAQEATQSVQPATDQTADEDTETDGQPESDRPSPRRRGAKSEAHAADAGTA